jgi:hypothetical protein
MPVSRTLSYDHPAYLTPYVFMGQTVAGASGVSPKFAAFTAMQIRACLVTPNVASTAAGSQPLMFIKSGTATSTTTLTALTSAAIVPLTNILSTAVSLAQGDQVWVTHGTDATAVLSVAVEMYAAPGAALAGP